MAQTAAAGRRAIAAKRATFRKQKEIARKKVGDPRPVETPRRRAR